MKKRCLPVLKTNARLWLRMGQCLLAIWELPIVNNNVNIHNDCDNDEYNGNNCNDTLIQSNTLYKTIIEANSTKRGNLYILPTLTKQNLINIKKREYLNKLDYYVKQNTIDSKDSNENDNHTQHTQNSLQPSNNCNAETLDKNSNNTNEMTIFPNQTRMKLNYIMIRKKRVMVMVMMTMSRKQNWTIHGWSISLVICIDLFFEMA